MILFAKIRRNIQFIEIIIDDEKSIFTRNGKTEKINIAKFLTELNSIVNSWPEYVEEKSRDLHHEESYEIKIFNNDKLQKKYIGINAKPHNYGKFIRLMEGDVYVRS